MKDACDRHFKKRHHGGQSSGGQQSEKHDPGNPAIGHGKEYLRQGDESKLRPGGGVHPKGKDGGEYCQPRDHRKERIANGNRGGSAGNSRAGGDISGIGDEHRHADAEGKESLTYRRNNNPALQNRIPVGQKQKFPSLCRSRQGCAVNRQNDDRQRKKRHQDAVGHLYTSANSTRNDDYGQGQHCEQPAHRCEWIRDEFPVIAAIALAGGLP